MKKQLFFQIEGFTLMEMIVVLVIIGLLIAGGIGFYNGYIENSKITKAKSQISVMQGAMDSLLRREWCVSQHSSGIAVVRY